MSAAKKKATVKNHLIQPSIPSERRCSQGRRHVDGEHWYAAKAVLSANEACQYMCVSRPTLTRLIATGRIRAKKVGRGWRILRAEIDRFLLGG